MISSQAASVVKEDRHSQIKWPVHHLDEICRWSVTLCVHFNIMILKNFYLFKIIFLQFYMKINQEKYTDKTPPVPFDEHPQEFWEEEAFKVKKFYVLWLT